jgi:hypothetical protein
LKKLNNTQQEENNIIELGMLSIMQMHYNATGTKMTKSWKDTFSEIESLYQEEIDTDIIEPEQETKDAIEEIDIEDDDDNSDDDDESFIDTNNQRKIYDLFGDEEDSDNPDREKTLGKESGHENILGNNSQDAVATDNETTESGKEATNDVSDKSDQEPATTNKSDAENTTRIWDKEEEDDFDPVIYSGKKKTEKTTINDVGVESDHESATTTKSNAANNKKRVANDDSQNDKGKKKTRAKKK